jgi:hypothetical protein
MLSLGLSLTSRAVLGLSFSPRALFALSEPGFWYDPSDVANLNWRRNLLTWTEDFSNAAWAKSALTVTTNTTTAPDGTTTADRFTRTTTGTAENNVRFASSQINATSYTFSCYVKAGSSGAKLYMRNLAIDSGIANGVVHFNPADGTVSLTYGSTYTGNASMIDVGGGWYRCRISGTTLNPIVNNLLDIGVTDGAGPSAVGGVSGAFVEVWGAQLEVGSVATEYQPITTVDAATIARFPTATLYRDTAGTQPVTTPGDTVALMLDKSGRGNHATQSTTANRPTYGIVPKTGRRNLLTRTEDFSNAAWSTQSSGTTRTANVAIAPDGTLSADQINFIATTTSRLDQLGGPTGVNTFSCWLRSVSGTFTIVFGRGVAEGTVVTLTEDWQRFSFTNTNLQAGFSNGETIAKSFYAWGAQLEVGSVATAYQRVTTQFDVTEAGVASDHYLFFGGSTDPRWMVTPTITPGIDKVQVFAGVRKLSDAVRGWIFETSVNAANNNGSVWLTSPRNASASDAQFASRGTVQATALASVTAAPAPLVLTGIGDIAGDNATLRVNGAQAAQSTADQGTGNYLAYASYIGARAGTSEYLNAQLFQLITRFGPNLPTPTIQQTERFVAEKTPEVTL